MILVYHVESYRLSIASVFIKSSKISARKKIPGCPCFKNREAKPVNLVALINALLPIQTSYCQTQAALRCNYSGVGAWSPSPTCSRFSYLTIFFLLKATDKCSKHGKMLSYLTSHYYRTIENRQVSWVLLPGRGTPIWNRRGCSSEILNLTPKGDHLGVAQAFCDP